MIRYTRNVLRQAGRSKLYSFINITGLAVGLATCMLIGVYVLDEISYDSFHSKADRIARVTRTFYDTERKPEIELSSIAPPYGPLMKKEFPEIAEVGRMLQTSGVFKKGDQLINEQNVFFTEPSMMKIFDIHIREGSPSSVLTKPYSMMISDKMAVKYFGNKSPVGKMMNVDGNLTILVDGVFESFPRNSHMHPDFMLSFSTLEDSAIYGTRRLETNWGNNAFDTYVLLPENYDLAKLDAKFPAFIDKVMPSNFARTGFKASDGTSLQAQWLTDIHLRSHTNDEIEAGSDTSIVYIFSAIAFFLFLIAVVNFINLSTALASNRAKEVGVKKVMGATRGELIRQFLGETMFYALLAALFALVIAEITLPLLNDFTGKNLSLSDYPLYVSVPAFVLVVLITGLLAGLYPAFFLSSFEPLSIIKGWFEPPSRRITLRNTLVVFQFATAITLIVCCTFVYRQMNFIQEKPLGYEKNSLVTLPYYYSLSKNFEAFRAAMLENHGIENVTRSSQVPTNRLLNSNGASCQTGDTLAPVNFMINYVQADYDFYNTYKIALAAGRTPDKSRPADDTSAFVLNETAVKQLGFSSPQAALGKQFSYGLNRGSIAGVVKDFHFESLHQQYIPVVYYVDRGEEFGYLTIRIAANADEKTALAAIEKTWKKFLPDAPFEASFVDELVRNQYKSEEQQSMIVLVFSVIAVFIACLGLLGLSFYHVERRIKEIGIRKVLGATTKNIIALVNRRFVWLILIPNLLAFPLAYWFISSWLRSFAFHAQMTAWPFAGAAAIALFVASITISFVTWNTARRNPVYALRYE